MRCMITLLTGCAICFSLDAVSATQPDKKPAESVLIVVDSAGKEHKLKSWKFIAGTANLPWLAVAKEVPQEFPVQKGAGKKPVPKPKDVPGPEALAFTEGSGPPLKKGAITYVLLENIRRIDFDPIMDEVTLRVARSDKADDDIELKGVTGYVAINVLTIEERIDLGDMGEAKVQFQGGVKKGIQSVRFPSPRPAPALAKQAKPYTVVGTDKGKTVHSVFDVQAHYRNPDGLSALSPTLYFKETVKLDLGKVKKLARAEGGGGNYDITLADDRLIPSLLLLNQPPESKAQLDGLVGRVPAGWKVIPLGAIGELNAGTPRKKVDI